MVNRLELALFQSQPSSLYNILVKTNTEDKINFAWKWPVW